MNRSINPVSIVRARDWCVHIYRTKSTESLAVIKIDLYKINVKSKKLSMDG